MHRRLITTLVLAGLTVVCLAAGGGYLHGVANKATDGEADAVRQEAEQTAYIETSRASSVGAAEEGFADGLRRGSAEGDRRGGVAGARTAGEAIRRRDAREAAALEAQRLADAADSGYEDDGGAYDPTPPLAGSYGSFEEFCADQPEETECGGPGDPAAP